MFVLLSQCDVPSLDQLKIAPVDLKVPSRASVAVSNDGCNWSSKKLYYTQYESTKRSSMID
jgi:hypothetical protein